MDTIEISKDEYAQLQKRPSAEDLAAEKQRADAEKERAEKAEKLAEEKETEAKSEKDRADAAEKKVTEAEEEQAKDTLGKERMGKLGKGFIAKLGEFTLERVESQARTLSDEEWEARCKELEETTSVKRDEGGAPSGEAAKKEPGKNEFTREETAAAGLGGGGEGGDGQEPSPEARSSVMRGLMPAKKEPVKASE